MAISHKLFNYFVAMIAAGIQNDKNITRTMLEDTSQLLIELSRDKTVHCEDAAWSAPLSDWLMSLLSETECRTLAATLLVNITLHRNSLTDLCHVIKSMESHHSAAWLKFEPNALVRVGSHSSHACQYFSCLICSH